ncbi:MAG: hypothetical protein AABM43_02290 [Actinomycetota bacterium]
MTLLVCSAVALATIPRPGKFSGATSQTYPDGSLGAVTIRMTHHGRRIRSFDITWLAPCDSGFTTLSQGTHAEGSVTSRGKFRGHGSYSSDKGNLIGTQYTATVTDKVRGRFVGRNKAKGTFQATAVLGDASGQPVSTCASPTITWRAKRG